jgi:hypothetical protein
MTCRPEEMRFENRRLFWNRRCVFQGQFRTLYTKYRNSLAFMQFVVNAAIWLTDFDISHHRLSAGDSP